MAGWIRLDRKLLEGDIGQDPNLLLVWIHLLMRAEWRDKKVKLGKDQLKLERGQIRLSLRQLNAGTHLSIKIIRRSLDYLEKTGRVGTQRAHTGTIITICKYKEYQSVENEQGTERDTRRAHEGHTKGTRRAHHGTHLPQENPIPTKGLDPPNKGTREQVLTTEQGNKNINTLSCVKHDASEVKKSARAVKPKIVEFTDEEKKLADEWVHFAIEICPTAKADPVKYAEAIAKTKKATDLNDLGMRKLFDFIRSDDFWRLNAYSPAGLLKKSPNNGHRKVDNILARMVPSKAKTEQNALKEWAKHQPRAF